MNRSSELCEEFRKLIAAGTLIGKLPSEVKLAESFGAAPNTVAKALSALRSEGLIERIGSVGTFVRAARRRINMAANDRFFSMLRAAAAKTFPQYELHKVPELESADLMTAVTTVPFDYGRFLLPYPAERMARLQKRDFHPVWNKVHAVRGECYGIPALCSPVMLAYNVDLMRQVAPKFSGRDLTYAEFFDLADRARSAGACGCSMILSENMLLRALYCGNHDIEEGIRCLEQTVARIGHDDFSAGNTLFSFVTFHGLAQLHPVNVGILYPPSSDGDRRCALASESVCVLRRDESSGILFELAELTLSPEFQRKLAAVRYGIPQERPLAPGGIFCSAMDLLLPFPYRECFPLLPLVREELENFIGYGGSFAVLASAIRRGAQKIKQERLREQKILTDPRISYDI